MRITLANAWKALGKKVSHAVNLINENYYYYYYYCLAKYLSHFWFISVL